MAEVASTQLTMPMISPRSPGAVWHAVSADRRSLLTWQEGSEDIQVLATGVNLLRPQVLGDHSIMTFSDTDPTLIVIGSDGTRMSTVVDLGGRRVRSFSVAPDAVQVALVLERGKTRALGIGLLSRQEGAVHLSHIADIPLSSSDVNLSIITDVACYLRLGCACWVVQSTLVSRPLTRSPSTDLARRQWVSSPPLAWRPSSRCRRKRAPSSRVERGRDIAAPRGQFPLASDPPRCQRRCGHCLTLPPKQAEPRN
ncbi:hypothetical protein JCM18920_1553 [Cutibacterium acnes JCM 18920]|nr:hypothetical protein JCM18920_1553 [Cutibacterium acnes JCM 18920]